ncbi:MAG: 30S ribosomal protein S8e [Nanoarchaeota archaeon]
MALSQLRSRRKVSGGRYRRSFKKKLRELGSLPTLTGIGKKRLREIRVSGGNAKVGLISADVANVYDPKEKKYFKLKIESVVDNLANRNYIKRNVMTKGAVIKTEKGNARITNRPGQEGIINAVLI